MFKSATIFNSDLSAWDLSAVTDFSEMFAFATSFEGRGIERWDITKVASAREMFAGATSFNVSTRPP